MSSFAAPIRNFRPEIQALRALAVLLVVIYHLEPRILPGGYIGVDIFLVISGFLITSHLLREAERTGRMDLLSFYAGRVRRILPAALLVIVVVVAGALLILPSTMWKSLGIQAVASALSVQNWVLAASSVDYLAAEEAPSALQHFWSLGVEEQFYVFWPLLVVAAYAGICRRWTTRALWIGFSATALASLAYSAYLGFTGDPSGYFVTTTRVWELAAGGLLALVAARRARSGQRILEGIPAVLRNVLVLFALAALAGAAFTYSGATAFPGIAALVPVLATVLIISAERTEGRLSLHPVVDSGPIQWVGAVSYSLYLWHWPLIVFATQLMGGDPGPLESVGLLALSLLLAQLSFRYVENPVRRWPALSRGAGRTVLAGAAAVGLVATLGFVPQQAQSALAEKQNEQAAELTRNPPPGFGAASLAQGAPAYLGENRQIVPMLSEASGDSPQIGDCVQKPQSEESKECEFGNTSAQTTIALVGDSHATHWYQAVQALVDANDWKLVTYLKDSCPFSTAQRTAEADGSISCSEANTETARRLAERGDIDVVLTANWAEPAYTSDPARGFAEAWSELEDAGINVISLVDTPRPALKGYARDCLAENPGDPQRCATPRAKALPPGDVTKEAGRLEPRVQVLDLTDEFCTSEDCPALVGNVLVYRDKHHVSDTYMRTVAPEFIERIQPLIDRDLGN
ncbi:acyltransferase family protein [Glutamicibacter protophormiae]|uniref:acyltransferase family protein n=1 Tax=Glutamicibacter protophormiae TaxID=37930 RepID=UPI00195C9566|nr:acyltransferase family protein [Glutamicibacter protophormiae]QRQ78642.1 acyltransferase [Glutamicibacter protophormiae]